MKWQISSLATKVSFNKFHLNYRMKFIFYIQYLQAVKLIESFCFKWQHSLFPGLRTLFRTEDSLEDLASWTKPFRIEIFFSLCMEIRFWSKLDATISLGFPFTVLEPKSFWFWCSCCCFILCRERILSCNTLCTSDSFSVGLTLLNFGMECTSDPLVLRKPLPLFRLKTNLQVQQK